MHFLQTKIFQSRKPGKKPGKHGLARKPHSLRKNNFNKRD